MFSTALKSMLASGILMLFVTQISAQEKASMKIYTNKVKNTVSPNLHGIFFEEISHGGEGGLYAELIQNRGFEESRIPPGAVLEGDMLNPNPNNQPHYNLNGKASNFKLPWPVKTAMPYWSTKSTGNGQVEARLSDADPLTKATPMAAQVTIKKRSDKGQDYFLNEGFWGINAKKRGDVQS